MKRNNEQPSTIGVFLNYNRNYLMCDFITKAMLSDNAHHHGPITGHNSSISITIMQKFPERDSSMKITGMA